MNRLRILLADDHTLVRRGVRALLESYEDMEVVGEAADGQEALDLARNLEPDLVLMDVHMPGTGGIEATRKIHDLVPETKVIMLTVSDDEDDLLESLRSGAQGYILKSVEPEQLAQMLRGAYHGEAPISPSLAKKIINGYARRGRIQTQAVASEELTPREREVLGLVARGSTNKEIAEVLFISENTVKNHLRNIMDKLHSKNRAQAVAYALEHGVIEPVENQA